MKAYDRNTPDSLDSLRLVEELELAKIEGGVKAVRNEDGEIIADCTTYLSRDGWWFPYHLPPLHR